MQTPPHAEMSLAPRATLLGSALPLLVLAAALLAPTARAGGRCSDAVCLELALPPHVTSVRPDATLELIVLLPAATDAALTVKLVLRGEGGGRRCRARYESLQPRTSWKRVMFRLQVEGEAALPPGVYSFGIARVTHPGPSPGDPCAAEGEPPRFLARTIRLAP